MPAFADMPAKRTRGIVCRPRNSRHSTEHPLSFIVISGDGSLDFGYCRISIRLETEILRSR